MLERGNLSCLPRLGLELGDSIPKIVDLRPELHEAMMGCTYYVLVAAGIADGTRWEQIHLY